MTYGWVGKILRVDLTDRKISTEDTLPKYANYLGGMGMCAKFAWDELPPGIEPFGAENKLMFATGVLTGTPAPSSPWTRVGGISPATYPRSVYITSGHPGHWGGELKQAGYDAVIIQGKAEAPVYVNIHGGEAEIRDAQQYWGKDTYETQTLIQSELGDPRVKILTIGPAGERLLRFATIMSGTGWASGQGGFGAVMGSKNLKAIAASGSGGVKVAKPKELLEHVEHARKLATMMLATPKSLLWYDKTIDPADITKSGMRFRSQAATVPGALRFVEKRGGKPVGCLGCPIDCFVYLDIPGAGLGAGRVRCMQWHYAVFRHRTDEVVWEVKVLQDKLGINAFELYFMIPWLVEMNKQGIISEADTGIQFSAYPDREFIVPLIEKLVARDGFGDILAEGTVRAAERIGEPALRWLLEDKSSNYGGWGMSYHYEPRQYVALGLQWATCNRDPIIAQHDYINLVEWSGLSFEEQQQVAAKVWGSKDAIHEAGQSNYNANEAMAAVLIQHRSCVKCSLGLCDWVYPMIVDPVGTNGPVGDTSIESKMFSAVTGIDMDEESMNLAGERIWNLERAIMFREGSRRNRDDDTLPPHFFLNPRGKNNPVDKSRFENLKDQYYTLRGWDLATGKPTREKLEQLDLKDVADELWR